MSIKYGYSYHTSARRIYVTNDFLPQFIDANTAIVPVTINLNSTKESEGIYFNPETDQVTIKNRGVYQCQFSIQLSNVAFPPPANPNPLLKFELQKNGGTIIDTQTSFNANSLDTVYVTSTLLLQTFQRNDKIKLVLTAPNPLPNGTVLRVDFASLTVVKIA